MSHKHLYQNELIRKEDATEEEQETCPSGYVKRFGRPARRERDCAFDYKTGDHCNEQENKAFWKGQKWKSSR